jgi:hypothetical protein
MLNLLTAGQFFAGLLTIAGFASGSLGMSHVEHFMFVN